MNALITPLILKYEFWPLADRLAWSQQFETAGLFEEGGGLRHWAEPTRQAGLGRYGQWLSFVTRYHPHLLKLHPAERMTEQTVADYIANCEYRGLSVATTFGLVQVLATVCQAFDGSRDWTWLKTAAAKFRSRVRALGLKTPIPISASEILKWSVDRVAEVEAMPRSPKIVRALHFRDALIIGSLIACPVRLRAFAHMEVGRNITFKNDDCEFRFFAEDMKDSKPRVFRITPRLVGPLHMYLRDFRPTLLRNNDTKRLWISRPGSPLSKEGLACHLADVTAQQFGLTLRPHAFRHIAATSIAEGDPEHVGIIRDVLGQQTLDMANEHYNRATSFEANRALQEVTQKLKQAN